MTRVSKLRPAYVEIIPEELDCGILYISERYRTASHLCCCGCGLEVVTPLNRAKWRIVENREGGVSMIPSIGNWSFPCRSHYWINNSCVDWAYAMTPNEIATIRMRDQEDADLLTANLRRGWREAIIFAWTNLVESVRRWLNGK